MCHPTMLQSVHGTLCLFTICKVIIWMTPSLPLWDTLLLPWQPLSSTSALSHPNYVICTSGGDHSICFWFLPVPCHFHPQQLHPDTACPHTTCFARTENFGHPKKDSAVRKSSSLLLFFIVLTARSFNRNIWPQMLIWFLSNHSPICNNCQN